MGACSENTAPKSPVEPAGSTLAAGSTGAQEKGPIELRQHFVGTESGRAVKLVEWISEETERSPGSRPVVLYVHGSPGGWSGARDIFAQPSLQGAARLLSLDRPGWGGSAKAGVEPSLAAQAEAVAACLRWAGEKRGAILVGHSLGGPVVARAAMDYPDLVQGLVILAGSVDPALEKTTWYQAIGRWRIVRWMLPDSLRLADAEIIDLRRELEAMLPLWSDLEIPVVIVHGEGDGLVPVGNVDFMERVLTKASVEVHRLEKRGHFVPWKEQRFIAERIGALLEEIGANE